MSQQGDLPATWLDPQRPHSAGRSRAQINGILNLLGARRRRVLDLGCGVGRVLAPLARAGHRVVGVDTDAESLRRCRRSISRVSARVSLIEADFTNPRSFSARLRKAGPGSTPPFDAILCVGNTWMTITDVDHAIAVLRHLKSMLSSRGRLVIDDLSGDFWPEVIEGHWTNGVSEDGSMQLVWSRTEPVFTLRHGDEIAPSCWKIRPGDRRFRLWTEDALRLTARLAGLSAPVRYQQAGVVIMARR